jgi:ribosomal-protein-alanine N-acetyltransferase
MDPTRASLCEDREVPATLGLGLPILRMFDVGVTLRFYVEYLGCTLDWQEGEGDRPIDLEVSRDDLVLHLSSYPDDGTPGTAVLIATVGLDALLSELRSRNYPFMNPGIEDHPLGRELTLIDPASNRLRFFERR